jgi:FkbM family methyltransferase
MSMLKDIARATVLRNKILARVAGKKYFGLNSLDEKVLKWIDFEKGFFIELGANDGITQSNTKYLELFRGWKGILIEPSAKNFKELKRNRSQKNDFFNCACVSFLYPEAEIELLFSDLMTVALQGENDLRDRAEHAAKGEKFLNNGEIYKFRAQARTLQSILEEAGAPKLIDLLSLDVEGGELEVLNGIDFERYTFKFVLIETRSFEKVKEFLSLRGMNLVAQLTHHDYLFARA